MSTSTTREEPAAVMTSPPEDILYEIVDGRFEELPPMSTQAAVVASRLTRKMGHFAEKNGLGEVVTEVLIGLTPRSRRKHRPDVVFVSYGRWPKEKPVPSTDPWPVVPELVVEVVSPKDIAEGVQAKIKEFLDAGVQLVWVIYPQLGWVIAYETLQKLRGFTMADELDAEPVLPGFRLPLRDLFGDLAAPPPESNGAGAGEA